MAINIKKIVQRIYEFNLQNCTLEDGNEMININGINEFVNAFRLRDLDKGVIITPANYIKGLVYKSTNGGEFYNNPSWEPDIITFSYNLFGLKKGAFYRVIIKGRNTRPYNRLIDTTEDRSLEVSNDQGELIIDTEFKDETKNTEIEGFFRANGNEANLFFRIGKIYINNIFIDEVELLEETVEEELPTPDVELLEEPKTLTYSVFNLKPEIKPGFQGRYIELNRLCGDGLLLYYDKTTKKYILERDNRTDIISQPFTNLNYLIDINFNKVPNKGIFAYHCIDDISTDVSPNTLKQGYITFEFDDIKGDPVEYTNENARLSVLISQIY